MSREHDDVPGTRAALALRCLPAARARLWLVRPDLGEAAASGFPSRQAAMGPAFGLLLLHPLPGVVVALGAAVHRHG
jgi:hypothetical protein